MQQVLCECVRPTIKENSSTNITKMWKLFYTDAMRHTFDIRLENYFIAECNQGQLLNGQPFNLFVQMYNTEDFGDTDNVSSHLYEWSGFERECRSIDALTN